MDPERFEHHLSSPQGAGRHPAGSVAATAGGGACCDTVTIRIALAGDRVAAAGYDADGCGSAHAAGSAVVALVEGRPLLAAARLGSREIAAELGGLSPGKLHAAEIAADALHTALGAAAVRDAALPPAETATGARPRTLVAMSGGVDSAVAALLCARDGDEVVAVTLELWRDEENDGERSCCSGNAVRGARALAHRLDLPHLTVDLRDAFRAAVVEPFLEAHAAGETPNPCVACNGSVRLDAMLALAGRLGCGALATGHYARTVDGAHPGRPLLRLAADPAKDQSYMLAGLDPASLARMRFPLGELRKAEVRALAAEAGLPVAAKPDSQDLCFLAGTDRVRFLERHGGARFARTGEGGGGGGELVDGAGRVVGRHDGQHRFTVGQRRGLGLPGGDGEPLYVLDKDLTSGRVRVGPRRALLSDRVELRDVRLHAPAAAVDAVKIRYRQAPLPGRAAAADADADAGEHRRLTVAFDTPRERTSPGQLACLLAGDVIVGTGTVTR